MDGKFDMSLVGGSTRYIGQHDQLIIAAMLATDTNAKRTLKLLKNRIGSADVTVKIDWQSVLA